MQQPHMHPRSLRLRPDIVFLSPLCVDATGWFKQPTNVDMLLREGLRFLCTMHKNRVSHRDIKPENFMWDGRLQVGFSLITTQPV